MTQDEIIALIRSCATETVDWDLRGNKLTDADVALWSTHGPLMMRVVRAAQRQAYERAASLCDEKYMELTTDYSGNVYEEGERYKREVAEEIRALIEGDK